MRLTLDVPPDCIIGPAAGKRLEPDYKVLQRLRQSCRITLERYVDVAGHCSGYLASLTPDSPNDLKRANLALLQQKEDQAHESYLRARTALLKYVLGAVEERTRALTAQADRADRIQPIQSSAAGAAG